MRAYSYLISDILLILLELRWPGDSQRESGRLARIESRESIHRKTSIFITCEAVSDSRESPQTCDSQFLAPQSAIHRKRGSVREPWNDSRESSDPRESANRFARIGPSKCSKTMDRVKSLRQKHRRWCVFSPFGWSVSHAMGYHSFRNHYILNSKNIKFCNCHGRKFLKFPEGNSFL